MEILVKKGDPVPDLLSMSQAVYFEEQQLRYSFYPSGIHLHLLDNAFKSGAESTQIHISTAGRDGLNAYNYLMRSCGTIEPQALRDFALSLTFSRDAKGYDEPLQLAEGITAFRNQHSGTRTYSPFALDRFKRLERVPDKWTMAHCKRALANGQFQHLKCNGRYSDDYAHDNAVNYHRGPIAALPLLESLVTSPSGWWTSLDPASKSVNVCCHTFDSNSFILDLDAAF